MASLIGWLRFSGARLVTGLPVSSGFARFYVPGSDVAVDIFADAAETEPLTQPVTLDAAGRAEVYCSEPASIVITTSTGGSVASCDDGTSVTEDQVKATWGGSPSPLSTVLTNIQTALGADSYAVSSSASASPTFEFNPNVKTNAFRCSYAGEIGSLTVNMPTPAPTIAIGKRFTIVFQFAAGTTLDVTFIAFENSFAEASDRLIASAASRFWSADFQKASDGKVCQITPWSCTEGDHWTV